MSDEEAFAVVQRPMPNDPDFAIACALAGGGIKGAETAAKAYAKIIVGRTFGFDAGRSLMMLSIVEGKPTFEYPSLLAFVRASQRYDYDIVERSETAAEVHWFRIVDGKRGDRIGVSRWTVEDSERAGLFAKKAEFNPHVKYPRAMLLARAVAEGIRAYVPDVVMGIPVYAAGELEEELAARAAIRAEARVVDTKPATAAKPSPERAHATEMKQIAQGVVETVEPKKEPAKADLPGTATVEMNGKHVAGPAPTAPAPKDEPEADEPPAREFPKFVAPEIPKALLERVLATGEDKPADPELANDVHSWAENVLAHIGTGADLATDAWKANGIDLANGNAEPLGKHLQGVFEWVTNKAREVHEKTHHGGEKPKRRRNAKTKEGAAS
jgi:hypothetical protein